jgi:hypothetical protein
MQLTYLAEVLLYNIQTQLLNECVVKRAFVSVYLQQLHLFFSALLLRPDWQQDVLSAKKRLYSIYFWTGFANPKWAPTEAALVTVRSCLTTGFTL